MRMIYLLLLATCCALHLAAADFTVKVVDKHPPKEISAPIASLLAPKAIQLLEGEKLIYEFWFCREIPLQSSPETPRRALNTIKQTTLLGAVTVPAGGQRDYKDNEVYPGVYTMRLGLQPNDGNHLGTADYPFFALLIQAKLDPKPDAITDYKSLTKASSKDTPGDHPVILSLRPVDSADGKLPEVTEPASDHKSIRLKAAGKAPGSDKVFDLVFDLVFQGVGHL